MPTPSGWFTISSCVPCVHGGTRRGILGALAWTLALVACTPTTQSPPPTAAEPVAAGPVTASDDREGARALAEFRAGTLRISAGEGPSWLLGKDLGPCTALPPERPDDFFIDLRLRPSGDVEAPLFATRYAVGADECEVVWSQLYLGKPDVVCSRYAAGPLDELYAHLRALRPHRIRTREIDDEYAPIHRGGYSVAWHWGEHACEISDSHSSQVLALDRARFEELVSWLQGACVTYGHDDCPGM